MRERRLAAMGQGHHAENLMGSGKIDGLHTVERLDQVEPRSGFGLNELLARLTAARR
jgi:hypothetical protein